MEPLKAIIVVAGGFGHRFGTDLPKQFFLWKEKMILDHTLENIFQYNPDASVFLVLSQKEKYIGFKIQKFNIKILFS